MQYKYTGGNWQFGKPLVTAFQASLAAHLSLEISWGTLFGHDNWDEYECTNGMTEYVTRAAVRLGEIREAMEEPWDAVRKDYYVIDSLEWMSDEIEKAFLVGELIEPEILAEQSVTHGYHLPEAENA